MAKTLEQRFWEKVDKSGGPDACWNWTAAVDGTGYGAFKLGGKKRNSHRIAYELVNGPINRHMDICHSCDNRLCCNTKHLSEGSRLANVHDAISKERFPRGETNGSSKLSDQLVRAIRALSDAGKSGYWIANQLKISRRTVQYVIKGETWKHVS